MTKRQLLVASAVGIFFVLLVPIPSFAQWQLGFELGMGKHVEHGSYLSYDGSAFTGSSGNSFFYSLLANYSFSKSVAMGASLSYDGNLLVAGDATTYSSIVPSTISSAPMDTLTASPYGTVSASVVRLNLYVQIHPFENALFFQAGPAFSRVSNVDMGEAFQFTRGNVTGSGYLGSTSTNMSAIVSAGYDLTIAPEIILSPMLTYEMGFTSILPNANLKISTFYGSAALKVALD